MPPNSEADTPRRSPREEKAEQVAQRRLLLAEIGRRVMGSLGKPPALQCVQVRWLWEDRFRVNVLVGPDAASVSIAHSYFLVADGDGNVLAATPVITRQY